MREEEPEPRTMMPETIPWKLLQGIALVQLYREEKWVEPPELDRLPYSLLYHQTMSTLASTGELTPAELAQRVLTLSYFHRISPMTIACCCVTSLPSTYPSHRGWRAHRGSRGRAHH